MKWRKKRTGLYHGLGRSLWIVERDGSLWTVHAHGMLFDQVSRDTLRAAQAEAERREAIR